VTHSGPEVLFKTCVAMKFVDDDDDDDDEVRVLCIVCLEPGCQEFMTSFVRLSTCLRLARISDGGPRIMALKCQCCGLPLR